VTLLKIEICDSGVHEKLSGREGDAKMRMDDSSVEGGGRGREKVVAQRLTRVSQNLGLLKCDLDPFCV
jgi:hypothetical protein